MEARVALSNEDIVRRILEELPILDLVRAQGVCTLWKSVSENVLKQRNQCTEFDIFTKTRTTRFGSDMLEHFFDKHFFKWRKKWTTLPDVALVFMNRYDSEVEGEVWADMFPSKCRTFIIDSIRRQGFVAGDPKYQCVGELDVRMLDGYCSMIVLPNLSEKVAIEFKTIAGATTQEKSKILSSLQGDLQDPDLKFFLIFATADDSIQALDCDLKNAVSGGVAVTGGVYYGSDEGEAEFLRSDLKLLYHDHQQEATLEQDFVAILIKGKDVRTASLCLNVEFGKTMEEINEEMCRLRDVVETFCAACDNHFEKCSNTGFCRSCNSQLLAFAVTDEYCIIDCDEDGEDDRNGYYHFRYAFHKILPKIPIYGGIFQSQLSGSTVGSPSPAKKTENEDILKSCVTVFTVVLFK